MTDKMKINQAERKKNKAIESTYAGRDLLLTQRKKVQKGPRGVKARRWSIQQRQSRSLRD